MNSNVIVPEFFEMLFQQKNTSYYPWLSPGLSPSQRLSPESKSLSPIITRNLASLKSKQFRRAGTKNIECWTSSWHIARLFVFIIIKLKILSYILIHKTPNVALLPLLLTWSMQLSCETNGFYEEIHLTHFSPMFHFYTRSKRQKTKGFLMFLGDIEMEHRAKIG